MDLNNKHIFEVGLNKNVAQNTLNVESLAEIDDFNKDIVEPKNFLGFYSLLIEQVLKDHDIDVKVNIAYEEEITSDGSTLSIYIQKGTLAPYMLNAPFTKFKNDPSIEITGFDNINPNETLVGCDLISLDMSLIIFSANRAEIEKVSYILFLLLMATSDDILNMAFDKVVRVDPAVMSPIIAVGSQNNYYKAQLDWKISFIDSNVLLFKKKMLKFTNLIVHDKQAIDQIKGQTDE